MPRQVGKDRSVGFARFYMAGRGAPVRFNLKLPRKGRAAALLTARGKPTVRYRKGTLTITGLPAKAAVAEVTLYRETKMDRATSHKRFRVKAIVKRDGAARKAFTRRPRAPR
jgi:hypothetical protein